MHKGILGISKNLVTVVISEKDWKGETGKTERLTDNSGICTFYQFWWVRLPYRNTSGGPDAVLRKRPKKEVTGGAAGFSFYGNR